MTQGSGASGPGTTPANLSSRSSYVSVIAGINGAGSYTAWGAPQINASTETNTVFGIMTANNINPQTAYNPPVGENMSDLEDWTRTQSAGA